MESIYETFKDVIDKYLSEWKRVGGLRGGTRRRRFFHFPSRLIIIIIIDANDDYHNHNWNLLLVRWWGWKEVGIFVDFRTAHKDLKYFGELNLTTKITVDDNVG